MKLGEPPGQLVKRENDPVDVKASTAKDQKARFTVDPPKGQTMEQFEMKVIEAFDAYGNTVEYQAVASDPAEGTANCNNFSSGLLSAAGVYLGVLPQDLPGWDLGWPVPLERGDPAAKRPRP